MRKIRVGEAQDAQRYNLPGEIQSELLGTLFTVSLVRFLNVIEGSQNQVNFGM